MGEIVPRSEESTEPKSGSSGRKLWLWMSIGAVLVLSFILLLHWQMVTHARDKAHQEKETPAIRSEEAFPMVCFTREDIEIKTHWTLLAGRHPVVKFRCALNAAAPPCKRAVLCYRFVGDDQWFTTEARLTRNRTVQITLRDLYRDMPYECFFVMVGRDTMFQSEIIRFET